MGLWWVRFSDRFSYERVIAVREVVSTLIPVQGWREAANIDAFADASFVPVVFTRENPYVL